MRRWIVAFCLGLMLVATPAWSFNKAEYAASLQRVWVANMPAKVDGKITFVGISTEVTLIRMSVETVPNLGHLIEALLTTSTIYLREGGLELDHEFWIVIHQPRTHSIHTLSVTLKDCNELARLIDRCQETEARRLIEKVWKLNVTRRT